MIHTLVYRLHDLLPYINWLYFFHAWGMSTKLASIAAVHDCPSCRQAWVGRQREVERMQAVEAERLQREAVLLLKSLDSKYVVKSRFGLFPAWSEGDDIVVQTLSEASGHSVEAFSEISKGKLIRLSFLRQQKVQDKEASYLCLSDFIAPRDFYYNGRTVNVSASPVLQPRGTLLGVFASAVDEDMEHLFKEDDFKRMLVQTLCDRLAEAATEKMHEDVRRTYWGYSSDENFSPNDLFAEKYEGRRPAVGYPSIPDQSVNFQIDALIGMENIGIRLTSSGMMQPHAAVSGFMFDHPAARHFAVGVIGEDQLSDYARRRNCSVNECRRFLSENLQRT